MSKMQARGQLNALFEQESVEGGAPETVAQKRISVQPPGLSGTASFTAALIFFVACALLFQFIGKAALVPPFVLLLLLVSRYRRRQRLRAKRKAEYATELPTVLLAMASLIKIGLPAHNALEKAVQLGVSDSALRLDLQLFSLALENGLSAEEAIEEFGQDVPLPELDLFRSAFLLVLDHGGQFAPTLERLAQFGRERGLLIESLNARTSGMRLTANCLLLLGPLILLMLSTQIEEYWSVLFTQPVARSLALLGLLLVAAGYGALRRMASLRM